MLEISLREFSRNPGKIMDNNDEFLVKRRDGRVFIVSRYVNDVVGDGEKAGEGDERRHSTCEYENGFVKKAREHQRKLNRWRAVVGSLDSDTFRPFVEAEW